ncbi:MAG: STAS domain-containing protein [Solirubrobacteraceae bacterium]
MHVAGELDAAAAPLLRQTLGQATRRSRLVVLDLRELTRVDSSGVHAIVHASAVARRAGRRLILIRGLSQFDRLLAMIGATDAVEAVDLVTGEPAVQALLHIARQDRAALRVRARAARRVMTVMGGTRSHAASTL